MQTIVYQCDTAMPAQKLPNCCYNIKRINYKKTKKTNYTYFRFWHTIYSGIWFHIRIDKTNWLISILLWRRSSLVFTNAILGIRIFLFLN